MDKGTDWRINFLDLYMSNNPKDFGTALNMKRLNMPNKLYRYRSIKTEVDFARLLELIQKGQLYCSPRNNLNDPFELRSPLSSKMASNYFGTNETKKSLYFDQLRKHFDEAVFNEAMQGEDWFDKIQKLAFEKEAVRSGLPMENITNALNNAFMHQIEDLKTAYESIFDMTRIASFSENYNNLPMWQHYSDEHRGVCLEYDTSKLQILDTNRLFPVIYSSELPDVVKSAFENYGIRKMPPLGLVTYHCIHKLNDWSYEKEWRYVFEPRMRFSNYEDIPSNYWNLGAKVDFIKPSKIILGNKVEEDSIHELCKVAGGQGIDITQMKITHYGLEEEHIQ